MRKTLFALSIAATIIGAAAYAQSDPQSQQPPVMHHGPGGGMMHADADHDGIVTRAEAMADVDQRFAMIDTNHDGQISADEMAAYRQQMFQRRGQDVPPPGVSAMRRAWDATPIPMAAARSVATSSARAR